MIIMLSAHSGDQSQSVREKLTMLDVLCGFSYSSDYSLELVPTTLVRKEVLTHQETFTSLNIQEKLLDVCQLPLS